MAVRNLTKKFVIVRNEAKANKNLRMNDNVSENSDNGLLGVSYAVMSYWICCIDYRHLLTTYFYSYLVIFVVWGGDNELEGVERDSAAWVGG